MKTAIVLILSCISVVAADTNDIEVTATTNTHTQPGILITFDSFTRAGQTNLLREYSHGGWSIADSHAEILLRCSLLGGYMTYPTHSIIYSAGQSPYSLSFDCDAYNKMRSALITSNFVIWMLSLARTAFFTLKTGRLSSKPPNLQKTHSMLHDHMA